MKITDFILEENPREGKKDVREELLSTLDDLYMDPIERELIKRNLENMILFSKDLPYVADLVIGWINFYQNNLNIPIRIEVIGMNNIRVEQILQGFRKIFSNFAFSRYEPEVVGAFPDAIFGLNKETLQDLSTDIDAYRIKNFGEAGSYAERKRQRRNSMSGLLIVEYLGEERKETEDILWCVIFDRNYNMHGYMALRVSKDAP